MIEPTSTLYLVLLGKPTDPPRRIEKPPEECYGSLMTSCGNCPNPLTVSLAHILYPEGNFSLYVAAFTGPEAERYAGEWLQANDNSFRGMTVYTSTT